MHRLIMLALLFAASTANGAGVPQLACTSSYWESTTPAQVLLDIEETAPASENRDCVLFFAVRLGSDEVVTALIVAGADVNARDEHRADVDARNEWGWTPLHYAAATGNPEMLSLLLDAAARVDLRTTTGRTALHEAASDGSVASARLLLEAGSSIVVRDQHGWTPLHMAARYNAAEMVKLLLEHGADPSATRGSNLISIGISQENATPLHDAVTSFETGVVQALIEAGTDLDARTRSGATPLHIAAREGSAETVAILLEAGSVIEETDEYGRTALYHAVREGNPETALYLIDAGARLDVTDPTELSLFEIAEGNPALFGTEAYWRLNDARFK
jgi:ankyrin repeat protein